ncbi:hypothetical protein [Edaphobacter aggregans]|uniref:hypothetical protein n=1 Tax=Edaphobacter aggregans TaxID=570835 RepID=UPI001FE0FA88|nr:hypothetical protein [Edaphobacter aggregans]
MDWTKPAAMAIPKEGYFKLTQGRYGPTYPRSPANYGFTIIAKIIPGREQIIRDYGKKIEDTIAGLPDALEALKLHSLRWVLFDIGNDTYFMYQGIFDTTSTSTPRTLSRSSPNTASIPYLRTSKGSLQTGRRTPLLRQVCARSSAPQLPRIRRVPVRLGGRGQEGLETQGRIFRNARPDAVRPLARSTSGSPLSRNHRDALEETPMLEFDDIQHFLMRRPRALAARYEFLSIQRPAGGREWLKGLLENVGTAESFKANESYTRWISIAFAWNGLRALGVDESSLATFPEEFRQGMAARAGIIGTTGASHPDQWVGGLASSDLHAIVILFARDVEERERCRQEQEAHVQRCDGVSVLSSGP